MGASSLYICKQNAEEDKFARALFRDDIGSTRASVQQKEGDDGWCSYPETLRQKPSYPRICHLFSLFIHIIHPVPVRDHPIQGPVKPKHMGKKKRSEFESTVASSKAGLVSILTTSALLLSMQCTGGESQTHMNTSRRHDPSRSLDPRTPL